MRPSPLALPALLATLFTFMLILPACGDDGSTTTGDTGTDAGGDGGGDTSVPSDSSPVDGGPTDSGTFVPGGERYTLHWGPVTASPGEEDTRCIVARLGNPDQVRIGQLINDLGAASHHLIVYRTAETEESLEPFACTPFVDTLDPSRGSPLTVSQSAEETVTLPEGVAYTLEPNQMIRLELHYINTTPEPATVEASTTFVSIAPETYEHEADFLFIGNPDISIPPRTTWTLGPTYFPLPAELRDVQFFSITGHTHQYGTNVYVETTDSASGDGTAVYDVPGWLWEEPETTYHEPAFTVPRGGGFRFTCDYENTSDGRVGFGESANDEMCFFWAYYYPSQGAKVCFHTDEYSLDLCCPGNPLCSLIEGYLM